MARLVSHMVCVTWYSSGASDNVPAVHTPHLTPSGPPPPPLPPPSPPAASPRHVPSNGPVGPAPPRARYPEDAHPPNGCPRSGRSRCPRGCASCRGPGGQRWRRGQEPGAGGRGVAVSRGVAGPGVAGRHHRAAAEVPAAAAAVVFGGVKPPRLARAWGARDTESKKMHRRKPKVNSQSRGQPSERDSPIPFPRRQLYPHPHYSHSPHLWRMEVGIELGFGAVFWLLERQGGVREAGGLGLGLEFRDFQQ